MRHRKVLTTEQKGLVREMMSHSGWKYFIELLERGLLADVSKDVLSVDISKGHIELMNAKARYDGAKSFLNQVAKLKEAMRDASEDRD